MQVSWIDPDEIAKLAAQLEGPLQREEASPWDLETLPDMSRLFTTEEAVSTDPAQQLADAMAAPAPEPLEQMGATPAPELDHIREKLRAIRSHAQDAGLLPPEKALSEPTNAAPSPVSDPPSFEIAPSRPSVRIPPSPLPATEPAADFPIPHSAPRVPDFASPAPLLPAGGSITTRLQIFMPWALSVAPCEDILLVDDHGDLLWGGSSRADLALSVVLAAGAGLRTGSEALTRSSVFIRSRLGEQKELSVLPCPTRFGMVTLALLNAASLSNDTAAALRNALAHCIDECSVTPAADEGAALSPPT